MAVSATDILTRVRISRKEYSQFRAIAALRNQDMAEYLGGLIRKELAQLTRPTKAFVRQSE